MGMQGLLHQDLHLSDFEKVSRAHDDDAKG